MSDVTVRFGTQPIEVTVPPDAAEARRQAALAETAKTDAESAELRAATARDAAIGYLNSYPDQAAGEAGTAVGLPFSFIDGNGEVALAVRTATGSTLLETYFGTDKIARADGKKLEAALAEIEDSRRLVIDAAAQAGATNYDKLLNAFTLAALMGRAGCDIVGGAGFSVAAPARLDVPGNTRLREMAIVLTGGADDAIRFAEDSTGCGLIDVAVDCGGINTVTGIRANGAQKFELRGVEVKRFSGRAIDISSNIATRRAARYIKLDDVFVHTPAMGVGHPIIIRSGIGGDFVDYVTLRGVRFFGADPLAPPANPAKYQEKNAQFPNGGMYSADAIVLQACRYVLYEDLTSEFSGAAAISITRGSSHVYGRGFLARKVFESFNLGSGVNFLRVADLSGLKVSSELDITSSDLVLDAQTPPNATSGIKEGKIEALMPDDRAQPVLNAAGQTGATGGGLVLVGSLNGQRFTVGTNLVQGGVERPIQSVLVSLTDAHFDDITLIDTGMKTVTGNYAAVNGVRCDGCKFTNVRYSNPEGVGNCNLMVQASNSTMSYSGMVWRGETARDNRFSLQATSSWLFRDPAPQRASRPIEKMGGRILSNKTITTRNNLSDCTKVATGHWQITNNADQPFTDWTTATAAAFPQAFGGAIGNAKVLSSRVTEVKIYDAAGAPLDAAFEFSAWERIH